MRGEGLRLLWRRKPRNTPALSRRQQRGRRRERGATPGSVPCVWQCRVVLKRLALTPPVASRSCLCIPRSPTGLQQAARLPPLPPCLLASRKARLPAASHEWELFGKGAGAGREVARERRSSRMREQVPLLPCSFPAPSQPPCLLLSLLAGFELWEGSYLSALLSNDARPELPVQQMSRAGQGSPGPAGLHLSPLSQASTSAALRGAQVLQYTPYGTFECPSVSCPLQASSISRMLRPWTQRRQVCSGALVLHKR